MVGTVSMDTHIHWQGYENRECIILHVERVISIIHDVERFIKFY